MRHGSTKSGLMVLQVPPCHHTAPHQSPHQDRDLVYVLVVIGASFVLQQVMAPMMFATGIGW